MSSLSAKSAIGALALSTFLFVSTAAAQCSSSASHGRMEVSLASAKADIVDTAVAAGSFETLVAAVKAAGLVEALKGDGPFTVFAPTDEAFAKLPPGTLEDLLKPENKGTLQAILTYHVVAGRVPSEQAVKLDNASTLNGQRIDLAYDGRELTIDDATVVQADIETRNGVIHVIDEVILPETQDIIGVATAAGSFGTLAAALDAAKLVTALQGDGPFTVFAPTDEAFAALPAGTVENLLKPENREQLQAVLTYHVVEGRMYSDQALELGRAATLEGSSVTIEKRRGGAFVNDSKLVQTDIEASNGVIHVIDSVLLPSPQSQQTRAARELIENAIHRGAPMYNDGHAAACTAIYQTAAEGLVAMGVLGPEGERRMERAMRKAARSHSSSDAAWIMRNALDMAWDHVSEMQMATR